MAIVFIHRNFGEINVYDASTSSDMKNCLLILSRYVLDENFKEKLIEASEYVLSPREKSIEKLLFNINKIIDNIIFDDVDEIQTGTGFYVTKKPQ